MKNLFTLTVIIALALTTCEKATDGPNDNNSGNTTLTIKNESSYELTDVLWNNVQFANNQADNSVKPGTSVTMDVQAGSGYIRFRPKLNPVDLRTQEFIVVEKYERKEYLFINNTNVVNTTDGNDTGLLASFCGEVTFQSFSPSSVRINNMTNERLVAFKGMLSVANLIGGIPAMAANHGLKRDTVLFSGTEQFLLVLITENQYNLYRNNLQQLAGNEFFRMPVLYSSAVQEWVYSISNFIGGSGRLMINNQTPYNVILHKDDSSGEILTFVSPYMVNYVINLQAPMEYEIYPEIINNPVAYNRISIYPFFRYGSQGSLFYWDTFLSINSTYTINISEATSGSDIYFSSGGAFFRIINNSGTAVYFWQGDYILTSTQKMESINPGVTENFFISFPRNPSDGTHVQSYYFSYFKIGTATNALSIPEYDIYQLDNIYEITVTGSAANLQLGPVINRSKIDLNSIVGF
jgi:hypothetical protein